MASGPCRRTLLLYVSILLTFCHVYVSADTALEFVPKNGDTNCVDPPIKDREQAADIILTAKVLNLFKLIKVDGMYSGEIQIKRVYKGDKLVSKMKSLSRAARGARLFGNYNKVLRITGLGDPNICVNSVMLKDTKIFFLKVETESDDLRLSASIIHMSGYTLKKVDAVVNNIPFDVPPPVQSPCLTVFCSFYGTCLLNATTNEPFCKCLLNCNEANATPVCGSDGKSYKNECELQSISCNRQRRIVVRHQGECDDPCDGVVCEDQQVCQLNNEIDRKPVCQCETSCEPIQAPVCGSDGNSYSNECMLRQVACQTKKEITVLYSGECKARDNPCKELNCGPSQDCVVNRMGQAACICPAPCWQVVNQVCGNDGVTYDNACELRRQSCLKSTLVTLAHEGPCDHTPERQIQCQGVPCDFDAVCEVIDDIARCVCPTCENIYDPVCGTNGISYQNDCEMKKENCNYQKSIRAEHRGLCTNEGCDRNASVCQFYSYCNTSDSGPRCVCPASCDKTVSKLCGTDGVTYNSECELRISSCKKQMNIYISDFGPCEDCNGVKCQHGAECINGRCRCPKVCPAVYQPVCASNDRTYDSECDMLKDACRKGIDLEVVDSRECQGDPLEGGSGEGSGEYMDCDQIQCRFGGTCELDDNNYLKCMCPSNCDAVRSPVCGSDGKTYGNKCELQLESCNRQMYIEVQSFESCDAFSETLCDGMLPAVDPRSGEEYDCYNGKLCPAGTYCHEQFGKCCNEDQCNCNLFGSQSSKCDPVSKECNCKEGVGGPKCDRCLPGYWGLHLIRKQNRNGCMRCTCNQYGSTRSDCHQMTGRCACNKGYEGLKCDRCSESGTKAGRFGCQSNAKSCAELKCYHGATCSDIVKPPHCVCDIQCPDWDSPTENYVCGENGITYFSECRMRQDGCLKQKDIRMAYRGSCKEIYGNPTPVPYTTGSRKTTRHIHPSNYLTNMTPRKAKSTPRPPFVINDRIGNVCIEDSYCDVPNSVCRMSLCKCKEGYISTMSNTYCAAVKVESTHSVDDDVNTCSMNPCLYGGECMLDDNLGYRCLCGLGRAGIICKKSVSFVTPSFSGSSYLALKPLGNITGDFYLDINFHAMNKDGIILFTSQSGDGTGQFVSIAISNGLVEFRFDMGNGPVQIQHPQPIERSSYHQVVAKKIGMKAMLIVDGSEPVAAVSIGAEKTLSLLGKLYLGYVPQNLSLQKKDQSIVRSSYHQVVAKKIGMKAMLIVDGSEPVAAVSIGEEKTLSLLGKLYLGYVPQNLSFIQEKIGVNLGFVGCIQNLVAGQVDTNKQKTYRLDYPNPNTEIVDGLDVGPCERNPCQSIPCLNGGSCIILNEDIYECLCPKGHSGANCEGPVNLCTDSPCHDSATCSITDLGDIICHCPEGREGLYCEYEKLPEIPVPLFTGDSYMILHVHDMLALSMSVEMFFLTTERNGMLLMSSQYLNSLGDFISLNIDDLFLEFRYDLGDGVVVIRSTTRIDLNKWHRVVIQRTDRDGDLIIDGGEPYRGTSRGELTELQLTGSLYIGGFKDRFDLPIESKISQNFSGAIQRIYLNGRLIDNPSDKALEKHNIGQYSGPPCNRNPCLNGGVCVPNLDQKECKCPKRYIGKLCEKLAENLEAGSPIRFTGTTYLQYFNDISLGIKAQRSNKFQFRFHTHQKHGMLIFQNQGSSVSADYFTIVISNSYIEMSYNLGKQSQGNLFRVRSTVYVSDGQWHFVYAERDRRTAILQVDNEPEISLESAAGATQLDTDGMLWIGGKSDLPLGLPENYLHGFKGCLGNVYLNNKELNLYEHRNGPSSIDFCH